MISAASCCAGNNQLDLLKTDDVIPTPLEISSPGGAGDILSLSCLGSYLTVRLSYGQPKEPPDILRFLSTGLSLPVVE